MARIRVLNLGGLNQYVNPLIKEAGQPIHSVNLDSYPYGAKTKRPGYVTYLGTADGSAVNTLFHWETNAGSVYTYRASGSSLYYSIGGTGAWTLAGNGTISAGAHVGYAVLGDTLIVGDGVGSTRHTTNGTSFTNTTLAPVSNTFAQYQNRIYAGGTASDLFYSTSNDATNWNTSGTSDSSSLVIPGEGKISKIFNASDRLLAAKTTGLMYKWDGYSLVDTSSKVGPSSPHSLAEKEGFNMWLNRNGLYGYVGSYPQLLSNPIQGQIYNRDDNGIGGTNFGTAPATFYKNDYYIAVGTVTPDLTDYTINDAIIKYDLQKNEFLNYSFANPPTAFHTFTDTTGVETMIFGDANGQCYKLSGTATSDNGTPIEANIEFIAFVSDNDNEFRRFRAFFNPGNNAKISIAVTDTFDKSNKAWVDLGDAKEGIVDYQFPHNSRGRFIFCKIYERSSDARFTFYGYTLEYDTLPE